MTQYQVDVSGIPAAPVAFVKALRQIARMSLQQASAVHLHLRNAPNATLAAGVSLDVAEHIAAVLSAAGATGVAVRETSVKSPLLLDTKVGHPYEWGRYRSVVDAKGVGVAGTA